MTSRPYALSWKPCQGDSLNLPDHRIHKDGDGDASPLLFLVVDLLCFAILGQMTYPVASLTLDSAGSYVMQGAPFTQGTIPSIPIGGSISPEGFLPSILLLVVIIVTVVVVIVILIVVVVDDVSLILKLSFVIIGFLHRIMLYYLIH
ncbi:hypothetical protein Tco_0689767 [Tanacetum coccineum]